MWHSFFGSWCRLCEVAAGWQTVVESYKVIHSVLLNGRL